jgi:hypothetical protein
MLEWAVLQNVPFLHSAHFHNGTFVGFECPLNLGRPFFRSTLCSIAGVSPATPFSTRVRMMLSSRPVGEARILINLATTIQPRVPPKSRQNAFSNH